MVAIPFIDAPPSWWVTAHIWEPKTLLSVLELFDSILSQVGGIWGELVGLCTLPSQCGSWPWDYLSLSAIPEYFLWLPQGELQPLCAEGHPQEDAEVLWAAPDRWPGPEHYRDHAEATLRQPGCGQLQLLSPKAQVGQESDHIQVPRRGWGCGASSRRDVSLLGTCLSSSGIPQSVITEIWAYRDIQSSWWVEPGRPRLESHTH